MITKISFVDTDDDNLKEFDSYGFNLRKDLKKIPMDSKVRLRCANELLDQFRAKNFKVILGSTNKKCNVKIVKKRFLSANAGKRGGLRLIVLVDIDDGSATIFHIYDKKNKEDLTEKEKKSIKKILSELEN